MRGGDLRGDRRRDDTWQQKRLGDEILETVKTLTAGIETARGRAAARLTELASNRKLQLGLPVSSMIIDAGGAGPLLRLLERCSGETAGTREAAADALLALTADVDHHCFLLRVGMLEALLRVASADTTETLRVKLREISLRMLARLSLTSRGAQTTLMTREGVVPMLLKHITEGSLHEKKWAAEVVEILMGNEEYRRELADGPFEVLSVIASLLHTATEDARVMDCAGRMLCAIYEDQTICHAQSPTACRFHEIQVSPLGGIPYFDHPPEDYNNQPESTPPGLEGLLCVLEADQCSVAVRERTAALISTLADKRDSARKSNMTLWMIVRKMMTSARFVLALNHLLESEVGPRCRVIVAELLHDLSDKGASRIVMCKNHSIEVLDRVMDAERDSYLGTLAAGALFNLSCDKTAYKNMPAEMKTKFKTIRDSQTLAATQRNTRLSTKTPVQVEWTPPSMEARGGLEMELSVVLP